MADQAPALSALLRRGGVHYRLPGNCPKAALSALVGAMPAVQGEGGKLLQAVLEREELMPTALGKGVALPHPRNPVITSEADQCAALAFTEEALDWGALDGEPVHTIILVVAASARMHLFTLQRITFFCRDADFIALLKRRAPAEELLGYIEKTEAGWT